jgi:hypothetical protein
VSGLLPADLRGHQLGKNELQMEELRIIVPAVGRKKGGNHRELATFPESR